MNCWLWIVLLLCCGGNGNNRCRLNCCNDNTDWNCCTRPWNGCTERIVTENNCGCREEREDCCYADKVDNCGCVAEENECGHRNDGYDCECHNHDIPYETFGCQENGIPCPPPIPTPYIR